MQRFVTLASRTGLALVLLLAVAAPALAHAELDTADPGPGDVVAELPEELVATFTQDIDGSRSAIDVVDADDEVVAIGGKDPDEPRTMRLELPKLAPGTYTVRWTTWSAEDDELERGTYTFTVATPSATASPTASPSPVATRSPATTRTPSPTPGSPTPSPAPTNDEMPSGGGIDSSAVVPIVVGLAVAAGFGFWLVRSRAP